MNFRAIIPASPTLAPKALVASSLAALIVFSLSGCSEAQLESDNSSPEVRSEPVQELRASSGQETGPRVARDGENGATNTTDIDFTFYHLAQDAELAFGGRCTADDIVKDSGWTQVVNDVAPKNTVFAVFCNK